MDIAQTLRDSVIPDDTGFKCAAAGLIHRFDASADHLAEWLQEAAGVKTLGPFTHGSSALVFTIEENTPSDFAKVARIAPYCQSEWAPDQNRPWSPFALQPIEREVFKLPFMPNQYAHYDSLSIEIMPKLNGKLHSDIPQALLENTGLEFRRNFDTGILPDGTPVLYDADAVNIATRHGKILLKPYAWLDPAWRQDHMHKIHATAKRIDAEGLWVVEENGVFYSKQQKLLGHDYLTRENTFARRPAPSLEKKFG